MGTARPNAIPYHMAADECRRHSIGVERQWQHVQGVLPRVMLVGSGMKKSCTSRTAELTHELTRGKTMQGRE